MPKSAQGFTLVELLVVLVIIGTVTAMVLFTVRGGGEERLARQEIRRMEHLVSLLADESVNRQAEFGIAFDAGGYRTLRWNDGEWHPQTDAAILRPHAWSGGVEVTLSVEDRVFDLSAGGDTEGVEPQVVFLSAGTVSPFILEVTAANGRGERIRVHLTTQIEREPVEGFAP